MSERCSLCEKRKQGGELFCKFHHTAMRSLQQGYDVWSEAFGEITKEEYYSQLEKHPETGIAVREVIKFIRRIGMVV